MCRLFCSLLLLASVLFIGSCSKGNDNTKSDKVVSQFLEDLLNSPGEQPDTFTASEEQLRELLEATGDKKGLARLDEMQKIEGARNALREIESLTLDTKADILAAEARLDRELRNLATASEAGRVLGKTETQLSADLIAKKKALEKRRLELPNTL